MKTVKSPIEEMITSAIQGCQFESSVDQMRNELFNQTEAKFPGTKLTEFLYFWEKAAGAKKKSIRQKMNGGDCH